MERAMIALVCAALATLPCNKVAAQNESTPQTPVTQYPVAGALAQETIQSGTIEPIADAELCNCCPVDCECCDWPLLYVEAEALFLDRSNDATNQAIVINTATSATLSTGDLSFDNKAGPRLLIGLNTSDATAWELSYFGVDSWDASATVTGNNNLRLPGDLALATLDFFDADIMRVGYSSELHNVELNHVRTLGNLSLLAGFRYLKFDEGFNINSTDFNSGTSDYTIDARNDLYGGQLGARIEMGSRDLVLSATGKAGIFGNDSSQGTFVGDFDNSFIFRDSDTDGSQVAFVGDLNFSAVLQLTNAWALRAGYNLIWIEGVALAADQLDFTDTPDSGTALSTSGGVFLHGANVGLEATW